MSTAADPAAPIRPGAAVRPGVVALVTALVVNIAVVLVGRSTGADLEVTQGGTTTTVGVPQVAAMTVGPLAAATVVLALVSRFGAHAWNLLAWAGLGIGVLTAALPLLADASTETRLTLAVLHVCVGFSWFLAVRRALPQGALASA